MKLEVYEVEDIIMKLQLFWQKFKTRRVLHFLYIFFQFSKKATPVKKNEKVTELSTKFSRSSPTKKASVTSSPGPSKPVKAEPASPTPSGSSQRSQR